MRVISRVLKELYDLKDLNFLANLKCKKNLLKWLKFQLFFS